MLNYHKHNLWRAFVDFVFDNDEKVASSQNYTHIKVRVQKPYPIHDQNGRNQLKLIPYLWPTQPKNHTLWSCIYLYSRYKGVPTPPGDSLLNIGTHRYTEQIDVSFLCVCAVIDHEFRHHIFKVAVDPRTNCRIAGSRSLTRRMNFKFMCLFAYWQ